MCMCARNHCTALQLLTLNESLADKNRNKENRSRANHTKQIVVHRIAYIVSRFWR